MWDIWGLESILYFIESVEFYDYWFVSFCVDLVDSLRMKASRTTSRNVRRLQETVNLHLNNYEKELFLDALNEYHSQKDTWAFVELLRTILNTPAKQQLVSVKYSIAGRVENIHYY